MTSSLRHRWGQQRGFATGRQTRHRAGLLSAATSTLPRDLLDRRRPPRRISSCPTASSTCLDRQSGTVTALAVNDRRVVGDGAGNEVLRYRAGGTMVIALHGRAAVSDHPDSHFVALGGWSLCGPFRARVP